MLTPSPMMPIITIVTRSSHVTLSHCPKDGLVDMFIISGSLRPRRRLGRLVFSVVVACPCAGSEARLRWKRVKIPILDSKSPCLQQMEI